MFQFAALMTGNNRCLLKEPFRKPCIVLLVLSLATSAGAIEKSNSEYSRWLRDDIMLREIKVPLAQPSTSDYLLSLAKAGEVNLFADATRFLEAEPPIQGEWKSPFTSASNGQWQSMLLGFFPELAHRRHLTWKRQADRTFLFWREPDTADVGRRIAASRPRRITTTESRQRSHEEPRVMDELLTAYFQQQRGWDTESTPPPADIKLADLPVELRERILDYSRRQITEKNSVDLLIWFDDDFWKRARVQIRKQFARDNFRALWVAGVADQYSTGYSTESGALMFLENPKDGRPYPDSYYEASGDWVDAQTDKNQPPTTSYAADGAGEANNPPVSATSEVKMLTSKDLQNDNSLQARVATEVKRRSLTDFLSDLQQNNAIRIESHLDEPARQHRLTARIEGLPLHEVFEALTALYGVRWSKKPDGTFALWPPASRLNAELLQFGHPHWFRYWHGARRAGAPPHLPMPAQTHWLNEISEHVDPQRLVADSNEHGIKGVPLSELPEELQMRIRHEKEMGVGGVLIEELIEENARLAGLSTDSILHVVPRRVVGKNTWIENGKTTTRDAVSIPVAEIRSPEGREVASIPFANLEAARERLRIETEMSQWDKFRHPDDPLHPDNKAKKNAQAKPVNGAVTKE